MHSPFMSAGGGLDGGVVSGSQRPHERLQKPGSLSHPLSHSPHSAQVAQLSRSSGGVSVQPGAGDGLAAGGAAPAESAGVAAGGFGELEGGGDAGVGVAMPGGAGAVSPRPAGVPIPGGVSLMSAPGAFELPGVPSP